MVRQTAEAEMDNP